MTIEVRAEGDIVVNGTKMVPMNLELLNIQDKLFEDDSRELYQLAFDVVPSQLQVDILGMPIEERGG